MLCLHVFLDLEYLSASFPFHCIPHTVSWVILLKTSQMTLLSFSVLQWPPVMLRIEFRPHEAIASCHSITPPCVPSRADTVVSSACSALCGAPDWLLCWHAFAPTPLQVSTPHLLPVPFAPEPAAPARLSGLQPHFTCPGKPYLGRWALVVTPSLLLPYSLLYTSA